MEIEQMVQVEWAGRPVLTSVQLAALYKCSPDNITDNFNRAKEQFKEGVHYFKLIQGDLREFKSQAEKIGLPVSPYASVVYLWTEAGCLYHCKMINNAEAWLTFGKLVQLYFVVKAGLTPTTLPVPVPARRAPSNEACVYAFDMSDDTVKIGHTGDIPDRIKRVERSSKLDVRHEHHSPFMNREQARQIERTLHRRFAKVRVRSEYFKTDYSKVCNALDELATGESVEINLFEEKIIETVPDHRRSELLIELLKVPLDNPLKEELFKKTAALLLGN